MVIAVRNGHGDQSSNSRRDYFNFTSNFMHLIILPSAIGKMIGKTEHFSFGMATVLGV